MKKGFKSLPNDKILGSFNLKTFADDKVNVTEKINFVLETVKNIVEKGENAVYQHFLLFPQCFQKGRQKSGSCGEVLRLGNQHLKKANNLPD